MSNKLKTPIHISELRAGMTVEHNVQEVTVCNNDVKHCSFMGYSFRGDASKKIVTRVQYVVPTLNGNQIR